MQRRGYPGLTEHRKQHQAFCTRFAQFRRQLDANEPVDSTTFFNFIADWLRDHLRGPDRELAAFLHGKEAA